MTSKKSNLNRSLVSGFVISMVLLLASAVASYYTITNLISSSKWVDHTKQVLQVSEQLISEMTDAETGQRGYALTKQADFLEPYNGSAERARTLLSQLRDLTQDNIEQQLNCDSLEVLMNRRYGILQRTIDDINSGLTVDIFRLRDGNTYMVQARLLVQKIQHLEQGLLRSRTAVQSRFSRFAPIAIILASVLAVVITAFFFKRLMDNFRDKTRLADDLREKDIDITRRIEVVESLAARFADGDYSVRVSEGGKDRLGGLAVSLNRMAGALEKNFNELDQNRWQEEGAAQLGEATAGDRSLPEMSDEAISFIAHYISANMGALYLADTTESLYIAGGMALPAAVRATRLKMGEGLVGQCFQNGKVSWIKNVEEGLYTTFTGGIIKPRELLLVPVRFEGAVTGVMEIGTLGAFTEAHLEFLERVSNNMGVAVNTANNRERLKQLLEETQAQSEELQEQHRELENINSELEVQAEKLQTSEEELKVQQEELMETNQELEERSRMLEEKNHIVVLRNLEIQQKAEELALSTKYKSEFLANMSHELRTPLNSVLLLSRLLSENNNGNLTPEQVEYASVIQTSGQGLLQLIDEILDLSKIEAGKLELDYERVAVADITQDMRSLFQPLAKEKNVAFTIEVADNVPGIIETDKQRLEQILKNLISNALKFTQKGSIDLRVKLSPADDTQVLFAVADTGIGIPQDKQHLIFEAFQQADGSTKRKFGGTGLGLSISRQLARLLAGEITLESEVGKGSCFTLSIPLFKIKTAPDTDVRETTTNGHAEKNTIPTSAAAPVREAAEGSETVKSTFVLTETHESLPDDRKQLKRGDRSILVVEDDNNFAKALLDFARQRGYKVLHTARGDEAFDLAVNFLPVGILMDIQLPLKDGLSVMDELKRDARTRHIPVHIMSSFEVRKESLTRGAIDFINKPVIFEQMNTILEKIERTINNEQKKVLIIEDNSYHAKALAYYLSSNSVTAEISDDVEKSADTLKKKEVNCVILDMGLPGLKAYEALDLVRQNAELEHVPVIIFTGQSLSRTEEQRIRQYADAIVVKTAQSYQRILNEVSLFLHLVDQGNEKRAEKRGLGKLDEVLRNKTVLVADDDVRNIFALTKALERHKMTVLPAVDGREALQVLQSNEKVDIVLMDMMMPEMDGFETIARIRKNSRWKRLPIIAVTAKAMIGDREKCMQAGASDYISKPVDTDQLLSLMRVWLYDSIA